MLDASNLYLRKFVSLTSLEARETRLTNKPRKVVSSYTLDFQIRFQKRLPKNDILSLYFHTYIVYTAASRRKLEDVLIR